MPRLAIALTLVLLVACASTSPLKGSRWLAEYIDGRGVIDRAQTTLEFLEDGKAGGRGGCNHWSGSITLKGEALSFGQMISTRMACSEALMDQESRFFAALRTVTAYRIENTKLLLLDSTGAVKASLDRQGP